jgi:hypothetical protein
MNFIQFDKSLVGRDSYGQNTEVKGLMFDGRNESDQLNIHAMDAEGLPSMEVLALPNDPEIIRKAAADLSEYADWLARKDQCN